MRTQDSVIGDAGSRPLPRGLRSNVITLLTYGLENPYFVDIVVGAQQAARARGIGLNVVSAMSSEEELRILRRLPNGTCDGIIDTGGYDAAKLIALHGLAQRGLPIVTTWHRSFGPAVPAVHVELQTGGYLATKHLIDLGHRHIVHVTERTALLEETELNPVRARYSGYRRALDEAGIPFQRNWLLQTHNSMAGGAAAVRRLLARKNRPTALFLLDDMMAIGALHALRRAGVRVPDDIAVVGFDGIAQGEYTTPELTTISYPRQQLGMRAVEMVCDLRDGVPPPVADVVLPLKLVVRESCGAASRRR